MKEQPKDQLDLSRIEFPEEMFLTAKEQDRTQKIKTLSEMLESGELGEIDLSTIKFPEETIVALSNELKINENPK